MARRKKQFDWRSREAAVVASNAFQQHVVGLRHVVRLKGETRQAIYTGFPLMVDAKLYWATAGHCFDQIAEDEAIEGARTLSFDLMDNFPSKNAASIQLGKSLPAHRSRNSRTADLGLMPLRPLFAECVLRNPNIKPLTPSSFIPFRSDPPIGSYMIGFPDCWTDRTDTAGPPGFRMANATASLACFPVDLIPRRKPDSAPSAFWGNPKCWYGRAAPFNDDHGRPFAGYWGMSGGLLVMLWQGATPDTCEFAVLGVQSACLPETDFVKFFPPGGLVSMARRRKPASKQRG